MNSGHQRVAQAYKSAVNLRSQRERDADVFDIFACRLQEAEKAGDAISIAKALADNSRLWHTVTGTILDDNNPQPMHLRKSLLTLANSVLQEMSADKPDIRTLIETNNNVAAGLRGVAPPKRG